MTLPVFTYASITHKSQKQPHPAEWKKDGTDNDYSVSKNTVLQFTDINCNNNKFYSLEIQKHKSGSYRLFSHYGRTDDLSSKGELAGVRECRYADQITIEKEYEKIIKSKLKKGYLIINLAKSKIGSEKARGQSSGELDEKTISVLNKKAEEPKTKKKKSESILDPAIEQLVKNIYEEAGQALTQTASIKITAEGFETPLGILTLGQVDKGFELLGDIRKSIMDQDKSRITQLSGIFYSTIPHKIGRTRSAIDSAVISTIEKSDSVEETLQLMKDMLAINQASGANLFAQDETYERYLALNSKLTFIPSSEVERKKISDYVINSQSARHHTKIKINNIYSVLRSGEKEKFNPKKLDGIMELFHGTRRPNVVGILTRGLLMPNVSARHGAVITGAMFGPGLYFADASSKSVNYCGIGERNSKKGFMFVAGVSLGKIAKYKNAQSSLRAPPKGFDSVMGEGSVSTATWNSLVHNEYIIYDVAQQELRYLIDFET